ncbi:ABC transporter permease [Paenibacillus humicola]|uniref:ABC transporter permease n=1 Tax=Paenibacillus humicola TaxID=3110540 RepID=UPI00237AA1A2|nr:ABC transporter permease [Paenibacillus humicola]
MEQFISYIADNYGQIAELSLEHLRMALLAVAFGLLAGVPLAIAIFRWRALAGPVLWIVNTFQTIPTLAFIGFMMIFFGLGTTTAVSVLFFYTLLPIVQSVYTGLRTVDAGLVEAAKGMGMTVWQTLFKVELPIVFPVALTGVRIATVVSIGTAAVMSLAGAGGLGTIIFTGINRTNTSMIVCGALVCALLAFAADRLLHALERKVIPPGLR